MEVLKDCPFCSGRAKFYTELVGSETKGVGVCCSVCGCRTPRVEFREEKDCHLSVPTLKDASLVSEKLWNRRV